MTPKRGRPLTQDPDDFVEGWDSENLDMEYFGRVPPSSREARWYLLTSLTRYWAGFEAASVEAFAHTPEVRAFHLWSRSEER